MSKYKNDPPIIMQNHQGLSHDITVSAGIILNGSLGIIKDNTPILMIPTTASSLNRICFTFHLPFHFNIKMNKSTYIKCSWIITLGGVYEDKRRG